MQLASSARQSRILGRYDSLKNQDFSVLSARRAPTQKIASRHGGFDLHIGKRKLRPPRSWWGPAKDGSKPALADFAPLAMISFIDAGISDKPLFRPAFDDDEDEDEQEENAQRPHRLRKARPWRELRM